MCILDDPMLALIARFVVDDLDNLSISDESFLKSQIAIINSHVKDAPIEEQQQLALSWIKDRAEKYRQDWQRKTLSEYVVDRKCHDCPLVRNSDKDFCTIHKMWVVLLNEYVSDKINSEKYIEDTLNILTQHKNSLKISELFK